MPTQEDSGEGRICTQRNSELAILEVSGALNQFPGGQANLINARSCSIWGWVGDRLGPQKRSVEVSPLFRAKWTKRKGTRWSERGGGGVPLPILPAPHLGTPGTLDKLSGRGEGLGSFSDSSERPAGSPGRPLLLLPPPSPSRCSRCHQSHPRGRGSPCDTKEPRAR